MDLKVALSVFTLIFIAELGDKTQLATMACAGCETSKLSVFIGSAIALVVASGLATLFGSVVAQYIPPAYLSRAAGMMFLVFGIIYILRP